MSLTDHGHAATPGAGGSSPPQSLPTHPRIGSIWQGGGGTCRVLSVETLHYDDGTEYLTDVRVERLVGKGRLLKRPAKPAVMALDTFNRVMRAFDPDRDDAWTRAIVERYGRGE